MRSPEMKSVPVKPTPGSCGIVPLRTTPVVGVALELDAGATEEGGVVLVLGVVLDAGAEGAVVLAGAVLAGGAFDAWELLPEPPPLHPSAAITANAARTVVLFMISPITGRAPPRST
jgi:hypothetical protein